MVDHTVELYYDGSWNPIIADVRESEPITITRGRRDWATDADPAECQLKLNNGKSAAAAGVYGRYSPRNPRSDLYGKIGRNTPVRVRIGDTTGTLSLAGAQSSYATTPDAPALHITGDMSIRFIINPVTWRPNTLVGLTRRYILTGDQRSWAITLNPSGIIQFLWSPDGTLASRISANSDPFDADTGEIAVRIQLDVDTGAGWSVAFETAPTLAGPWPGTPHGGAVGTPATSVHAGTAPLEVGRANPFGITSNAFAGAIRGFELRAGLDGDTRAGADFTGLDTMATSFTGTAGLPWTLEGAAVITDPSIRFTGEGASWPQQWDLSGADQWVRLTAAGVSRRLQQGKKPLKSPLFRDLSTKANVVAYWPLEEPPGAERFRSGLANDASYLTIFGDIKPATFEGFAASSPLPEFGVGTAIGNASPFTGAADQRFIALVAVPAEGLSVERRLFTVLTTGTIRRWEVNATAGGGLRITVLDEEGNTVDTALGSDALNGRLHMVSLWLEQQGANVHWQLARFEVGELVAFIPGENTIAGHTYGRMSGTSMGSGNGLEGTSLGHAAILNDDVHSIWDLVPRSLIGWAGETAADRLLRLTNDAGLHRTRIIGDGSDTEPMGPQRTLTLTQLTREIPAADLGIRTDRTDAIDLAYRTRTSLYSQDPKLVLDYSTGVIAEPFLPVDDDQTTRNTVTVERPRGSSYTAVLETGPMSVQDPPDGVGIYDHSGEVNIDTDARLPSHAGWQLHLGTVDAARYPSVRLNLRNPRVAAMAEHILALTEGDIIRIINLPPQLPPGPIDLFVEGLTEDIGPATHEIEFNCSPGDPWRVFTIEDDVLGRLDTGGSSLALPVDATETEILVATDTGSAPWTTITQGLQLPGSVGDYASTPSTPALQITGSIRIRALVSRTSWAAPGDEETIAAIYADTTQNRAWRFALTATGFLLLQWTTDGTTGTIASGASTAMPVATTGPATIALEATLEVATGDVTFRTAPTLPGSWDQLGITDPGAGPTSIFAGAAALEVGARDDGTRAPWNGTVHALEVYDVDGQTVAADTSFADQATGTGVFTDETGLQWTVHGAAVIGPSDEFAAYIGAEIVHVHRIRGAESPQEFSVVRGLNGFQRDWPAGTRIRLAPMAVGI